MKKILPVVLYILSFFSPVLLRAQTSFSLQSAPSDSITYTYTGTGEYPDNITNTSANGDSITITWHVVNTNFPATWLTSSAFGFCDNNLCYPNFSNSLWNGTTGGVHTSAYLRHDSTSLFALSLALPPSATAACYWMKVAASVTGSTASADTVTFVICQPVTSGVTNIGNTESNVTLYPNPARDELNLVYDANADVKNIAVYNIIGKIMAVYKVSSNSSANLNLENIPSGFYFVRLANSFGEVVATKKFTKQ